MTEVAVHGEEDFTQVDLITEGVFGFTDVLGIESRTEADAGPHIQSAHGRCLDIEGQPSRHKTDPFAVSFLTVRHGAATADTGTETGLFIAGFVGGKDVDVTIGTEHPSVFATDYKCRERRADKNYLGHQNKEQNSKFSGRTHIHLQNNDRDLKKYAKHESSNRFFTSNPYAISCLRQVDNNVVSSIKTSPRRVLFYSKMGING